MQIAKQVKTVGISSPAFVLKALASQLTLEQLKEMSTFIGVETARDRATLEFKCRALRGESPLLETRLKDRTLSLNLTKIAKRQPSLAFRNQGEICVGDRQYALQDWAQALRQGISAATVMENAANVLQRTLANWVVAEGV